MADQRNDTSAHLRSPRLEGPIRSYTAKRSSATRRNRERLCMAGILGIALRHGRPAFRADAADVAGEVIAACATVPGGKSWVVAPGPDHVCAAPATPRHKACAGGWNKEHPKRHQHVCPWRLGTPPRPLALRRQRHSVRPEGIEHRRRPRKSWHCRWSPHDVGSLVERSKLNSADVHRSPLVIDQRVSQDGTQYECANPCTEPHETPHHHVTLDRGA